MPKVTKFHEYKLIPSYQALTLHCKRADYVLKLIMSTPWYQSPFLPCFEQFDWHKEDTNIMVTWDEVDSGSVENDSDTDSERSYDSTDSSDC